MTVTKKEEIDEIGIKAYSLKMLKEKGIMDNNLYISRKLPSKDKFFEALKNSGFVDGDEISSRVSHPKRAVGLPRKLVTSFEDAYSFYKDSLDSEMTIVMHDFFHAKYGGMISVIGNDIVLEITESDWNIDYVLNNDTAVFKDTCTYWYLYRGVRNVAYIDKDNKEKYKEIKPLEENIAREITVNLKDKIAKIKSTLSDGFSSIEVLIDDNYKIFPLQLSSARAKNALQTSSQSDEVYEVRTLSDLHMWDKKTELLVSIPATEDKADDLMQAISLIRKYKDRVYISYGVLSHPAILFREAGINVDRRMSNYKVVKFSF